MEDQRKKIGRVGVAVFIAIKKGILKRPIRCAYCKKKSKKIIAHHKDYNKPLKVIWLCLSCHKLTHLGYSKKRGKK